MAEMLWLDGSVGRALEYKSKGRGFKSHCSRSILTSTTRLCLCKFNHDAMISPPLDASQLDKFEFNSWKSGCASMMGIQSLKLLSKVHSEQLSWKWREETSTPKRLVMEHLSRCMVLHGRLFQQSPRKYSIYFAIYHSHALLLFTHSRGNKRPITQSRRPMG